MQCALLLHLVIDFPYSTPASAVNLSGDRTKRVGKDMGSKSTELGRYSQYSDMPSFKGHENFSER
jgi:hypothetical protein